MRLYDVGKDHEETMRLIINVRLITRVYGSTLRCLLFLTDLHAHMSNARVSLMCVTQCVLHVFMVYKINIDCIRRQTLTCH